MLLILMIALVPLPALASETTSGAASKSAKPAQVSLHQMIAREAARTPVVLTSAARKAEQGATSNGSGFLHSRPGLIALAVMAAGGGYAVYSLSHDRVRSPAKK
jgi:hypothetical protein